MLYTTQHCDPKCPLPSTMSKCCPLHIITPWFLIPSGKFNFWFLLPLEIYFALCFFISWIWQKFCLTLFSMILSKFIYIVANGIGFLFSYSWLVFHYIPILSIAQSGRCTVASFNQSLFFGLLGLFLYFGCCE